MTDLTDLRPGEVVQVADLLGAREPQLSIALSGHATIPDLIALTLGESGKVRGDEDLIFYNNPTSLDGGVSWLGPASGADWLTLDLTRVDADTMRIIIGCAGGALGMDVAGSYTFIVGTPQGHQLARATVEAKSDFAAMILAEVYRRHGRWRLRFLAQGYAEGLTALVTEFGVVVDTAPDDVPKREPSPGPKTVRPRPTPTATVSPAQPAPVDNQLRHGAPADQTFGNQKRDRDRPDEPTPSSSPPDFAHSAATRPPETLPENLVQPWAGGTSNTPTSSAAAQPVFAPPPVSPVPPAPRRGGLFTSRKRAELEAQNAELHRLLDVSGAHHQQLNDWLISSGALDRAAVDAERLRLAAEVARLAAEADRRRADVAGLEQRLTQLRGDVAAAEGDAELADVGVYRFRHRLDDSVAYRGAIAQLRDRIKDAASNNYAVTGNTNWTVNGSQAQGRKMIREVSKLMLRAYNADADHAVRTMRAYKLDSALTRLDTTRRTIARLGTTMDIRITDIYHRLRREELELTADYLAKADEEKERQRQLREDQREQQRAEAEYVREQERLERERHRYQDALDRLQERGETQKAIEVRSRLTSVDAALAGLAQRRANLRLGHVYVISNIGAFGRRMVKIGMTRRLDPLDRVRELGDASVPFRFDVHAMIFSEDAVALENALHRHFADRRVNQVNNRREFFYVTPAEVRDAIAHLDSQYLLTYTEDMEAPEWRQSGGPDRALLPT